ncbi:unnamed protein product [Protopolystoma xenopodis]|uniref:Uncharacterized protein n=1 Tax=Protopolystoma xenopodis TaxID=117903 RepID=A0A3S5FBR6_9PLAT|nr:unnamed protein product [Protopolystoma xenopodis]
MSRCVAGVEGVCMLGEPNVCVALLAVEAFAGEEGDEDGEKRDDAAGERGEKRPSRQDPPGEDEIAEQAGECTDAEKKHLDAAQNRAGQQTFGPETAKVHHHHEAEQEDADEEESKHHEDGQRVETAAVQQTAAMPVSCRQTGDEQSHAEHQKW